VCIHWAKLANFVKTLTTMRQITVQVPDQQYDFFMQLVQNLKFAKVKQESPLEAQLSASQEKTWKNIKQGFEELRLVEEGKLKTIPAEDFLEELKNEGYL
jgi:hypothetical protein